MAETRKPSAAFQILLSIRHPSIDPSTISRTLQQEPDYSFAAGEPRKSASGLAEGSTHSESYWLATLKPVSMPLLVPEEDLPPWAAELSKPDSVGLLGRRLMTCVAHLRKHASFLHKIRSEGGEIRLRVQIPLTAIEGFTLLPDLAHMLDELRTALEFEFIGR